MVFKQSFLRGREQKIGYESSWLQVQNRKIHIWRSSIALLAYFNSACRNFVRKTAALAPFLNSLLS